jgi:hypothetical protein
VSGSTGQEWLNKLPYSYVACRSIRHAWIMHGFQVATNEERETVTVPANFNQVIKRELSCSRCGANRVEYFGRDSHMLRDFSKLVTRYTYDEGYTYVTKEHSDERPKNRDFNRELFNRVSP